MAGTPIHTGGNLPAYSLVLELIRTFKQRLRCKNGLTSLFISRMKNRYA